MIHKRSTRQSLIIAVLELHQSDLCLEKVSVKVGASFSGIAYIPSFISSSDSEVVSLSVVVFSKSS